MDIIKTQPLHLDAKTFRFLFEQLGPSLGLWRGAEVAVLRTQVYAPPVLDLGCGDGLITSLVIPRVAYGVDPYQTAYRQAVERGLYEQLINRPVENAGIADGSVGTIMSNSVFEHLPDPGAVLQSAARLLRPGGRLVFTSPSAAFGEWLALPARRYRDWRNRHFEHLNLWSPERWAEQLEKVGMEIVEVRPYLRRRLVWAWDTVELLEGVWVARRRLVGMAWKRLSPQAMERIALRAGRMDLASPPPGGGQMIAAVKR